MDRRIWLLAGALACAPALGCGEDAPERSMVPQQRSPESAGAAANRAPVVELVSLDPRRPRPGESVRAVVDAQDPDGDKLRIEYHWRVNERPMAGGGATLDGRSLRKDDRIELVVVASDGAAQSEPVRASARVVNRVPEVADVRFDPSEDVKPGDVVTALVEASDDDDDALRFDYVWMVNGDDTRERGRTFSTEGLRRGDRVQVRVRAQDGDDQSEGRLSPVLELANRPPVLSGVPAPERDGDAFRYRFEASDPDGDRALRFSLGEAPPGMTIDPIYGIATWRPSHEQAGKQVIEVQVADKYGDGTTLRFEVEVSSTEKKTGDAPPANPAE